MVSCGVSEEELLLILPREAGVVLRVGERSWLSLRMGRNFPGSRWGKMLKTQGISCTEYTEDTRTQEGQQ